MQSIYILYELSGPMKLKQEAAGQNQMHHWIYKRRGFC